jgi:hypothetical protein
MSKFTAFNSTARSWADSQQRVNPEAPPYMDHPITQPPGGLFIYRIDTGGFGWQHMRQKKLYMYLKTIQVLHHNELM